MSHAEEKEKKDTKQKKNVETDCGRLFTDIQNIHKYINIYTYI